MTLASLTRIQLNPRHPAVRKDLADAIGLHKTVMRLAPQHLGEHPRRQGGVLFRLDEDPSGTVLLVQTTHLPDLGQLPAGYGHADTRDLGPMFKALTAGIHVRYRIAGNAAKRLRPPAEQEAAGRTHGKVVPLHGEEAAAWWRRRSAEAGLDVHTVLATQLRPACTRTAAGPRHELTRFDGTATVTDPTALAAAIVTGIGKGKPYGAGLLSLAPAGCG
ncbi:type I-E CRISPR-associated protein Cas6/Cse3/CasE [Streptacidiphilus cavernicola]|uniref:Type I-E CRISPR-associated protein Cas6/Cse3/CasE n=1 Tax=Streptacidiphilus cavernicola TaxID=3342716 RepID=A0ABV6VW93_9ACTN